MKETTMPQKKTPSKSSGVTPRTKSRKAPDAPNDIATPGGPADGAAAQFPSDEDIARKAYALWESRGRPFGSPDEDWYKAMQELHIMRSASPGK
jgi:hypothetical protein